MLFCNHRHHFGGNFKQWPFFTTHSSRNQTQTAVTWAKTSINNCQRALFGDIERSPATSTFLTYLCSVHKYPRSLVPYAPSVYLHKSLVRNHSDCIWAHNKRLRNNPPLTWRKGKGCFHTADSDGLCSRSTAAVLVRSDVFPQTISNDVNVPEALYQRKCSVATDARGHGPKRENQSRPVQPKSGNTQLDECLSCYREWVWIRTWQWHEKTKRKSRPVRACLKTTCTYGHFTPWHGRRLLPSQQPSYVYIWCNGSTEGCAPLLVCLSVESDILSCTALWSEHSPKQLIQLERLRWF